MLSFSSSSCKIAHFFLDFIVGCRNLGRDREKDLKQRQYLGMALVCRFNQPVLKPIRGKYFGPKKQGEH